MKTLKLLLLFCIAACVGRAQDNTSENQKLFNGNRFILGNKTEMDTVVVVDPITGQETERVHEIDPLPVSMNGIHISSAEDVDTPAVPIVPQSSVEEQIISAFKGIWDQFPYEITLLIGIKHIVVDQDGRVVYTDYSGLRGIDEQGAIRMLGSPEPETLFKDIVLRPAVKRGYKVLCSQRVFMNQFEVKVKNHELLVRRK